MPLFWRKVHGRGDLSSGTVKVGNELWLVEDYERTQLFSVVEEHGPFVRRALRGRLRRHSSAFQIRAAPYNLYSRSVRPWVAGVSGFRGQSDYLFCCDLAHWSGALTVTSRDYSVSVRTAGQGTLLAPPNLLGKLLFERKRVTVKTTSDPRLYVDLVAPWTEGGPEILGGLLEDAVGAAIDSERWSIGDATALAKDRFLPDLPPPDLMDQLPLDVRGEVPSNFPTHTDDLTPRGHAPEELVALPFEVTLGEDEVWSADIVLPVLRIPYAYAVRVRELDEPESQAVTDLQVSGSSPLT